MTHYKKQTFVFKILKNNPNINIQNLESWINETVKDAWHKRAHKHVVVYTFTSPDDAFKFKFRWTFA